MANKYIIGTTSNEYVINNILMPKKSYDDVERSKGKCPYTEVSDTEIELLETSPVYRDLVAKGVIKVLSKLPAFAMTGEEKAVQFKRQLSTAEKKLEEAESSVTSLNKKLAAKDAEIEKLKEKLASLVE